MPKDDIEVDDAGFIRLHPAPGSRWWVETPGQKEPLGPLCFPHAQAAASALRDAVIRSVDDPFAEHVCQPCEGSRRAETPHRGRKEGLTYGAEEFVQLMNGLAQEYADELADDPPPHPSMPKAWALRKLELRAAGQLSRTTLDRHIARHVERRGLHWPPPWPLPARQRKVLTFGYEALAAAFLVAFVWLDADGVADGGFHPVSLLLGLLHTHHHLLRF